MIKKILATISTFLLLSLSVSAMGMGGVGGGVSSPQYWRLTSGVLSPIDSSWSLNIAGGITFGASTMAGDLNMGGYKIVNNASVTGLTTLTLSTLSNSNLILLPHGTGKTVVGDAVATPVSLGANNDSLFVTKDLEVGDNIFTGGITMATDRGDVPWVDWSVTSASADGTAQSLPFLIGGQWIGEPYAESNGAGGVQNMEWRTRNLRNYGDLITTRMTLPNGTALPATCAVGNVFLDTDDDDCSDSGGGDGALCICKSSDTWVLLNNI